MKIELSEATFQRLQRHATPLVDNVEDVIVKILNAFEGNKSAMAAKVDLSDLLPPDMRGKPRLKGFPKELWDLVICKIPTKSFSLHDVYQRQGPLKERRAHVQELEASIRAALQKLRDMGYIEFLDNRGQYKKIIG